MSKKLEHLRTKDSKAFWNLLKGGFDTNKVGNNDMDDWFQHFATLFFKNKYDHSIVDFEQYTISIEELDTKISFEELRDAICITCSFRKLLDRMVSIRVC